MPNEKLIFLSFPVFKTIFAASNQSQQKSNSRTANSDEKKEKATIMFNAPHGVTKKSCLHVVALLFQ